jgi:hypoxanthine phosphoribosyltransferase
VARPLKPFITERRLQARVRALGRAIRSDYAGRDLVLVGILKGSFIFMADLARAVDLPLTCDFMRVSSYGSGTVSSGKIRMEFDLSHPVKGKDVLLVEDIVDTGWTLNHVLNELRKKKPASLRLAALLHKPDRTRVDVPIDYLGFTIPDRFVVGYGLDFDGRYRNLPYVAVLNA